MALRGLRLFSIQIKRTDETASLWA
ncbi:MAG: hypothetical protein QOE55_4208, partial [Acidobacteriaceae bacterium]|nr:hypothetical protein [Acidobacteriaceae bacterium]